MRRIQNNPDPRKRAWLQDGDKQILKSQGWEDPSEEAAIAENRMKHALGPTVDPYEYVSREVVEGNEHSGKYYESGSDADGMQGGYLRAPSARGGYISAPGGGFLPLAAIAGTAIPIIASLLPALIGSGKPKPAMPLNMSNGQSFFRSLFNTLAGTTGEKYANKKMEKLFGSGWKQYSKNRVGGSRVVDELRMGHLMMPLALGHLRKALGRGMDPEVFLDSIEKMNAEQFRKVVTPEMMTRGGSILGSLWSGIKNVISKIASSGVAQKIGESALKSAEKVLPSVAEKGVEKLAEYATKKLTGDEPEIAEDKKSKKVTSTTGKKIEAESVKPIERKLVKDVGKQTKEPAQQYYRYRESGWTPYMKPKGKDEEGHELYGYGYGKKKRMVQGGAWEVKLTRS